MEETKFNRAQYLDGQPSNNPSDMLSQDATSDANHISKGDEEQDVQTKANVATSSSNSAAEPNRIDASIPPKSYLAKLKPIRTEHMRQKNRVLMLLLQPFKLLSLPIVVYAGFLYGCNIVWLSVLNATESMILSAPPYSMSTSTVGLTFIAPLVGTTLA